jgi:hypothetical protein
MSYDEEAGTATSSFYSVPLYVQLSTAIMDPMA